MNIALFGGTFDPVHRGHLAVARVAVEAFALEQVYFVLAAVPPHKQSQPITEYHHRFSMLQLAVADDPRFIPSRIEEPQPDTRAIANYSIDTVRRFKKSHLQSADKLYFIVGMDSFLDIRKWKQPEALLSECDFIVASRPGYRLEELTSVLPDPAFASRVHLIETVAVDVSSTQIREAVAKRQFLEDWVLPAVAEYIRQHGLYR
jgi:nicotinate-nucleotide adenylyltransferase